MKLRSQLLAPLAILALVGLFAPVAPAETYESVHTIASRGSNPLATLVRTDAGDFLGVTFIGGGSNYGSVFKISGGTYSTLSDFIFPGGIYPSSSLTKGTDGKYYGVTYQGGSFGLGTLYRISPGGTFETLASFSGANGAFPQGRVVQGADGSFYGLAAGGAKQKGVIFKYTAGKGLTIAATFDGTLGSVLERNLNSLVCFAPGLTKGADGSFYGVTSDGGSNSFGTAFKYRPGGSLSLLATFGGANPKSPAAPLVQAQDGNFYGTATAGGANDLGAIYQLTPSGTFTLVASFDSTTGSQPFGELIQDGSGTFYGTTRLQGAAGIGTVYKMTLAGSVGTISKLADASFAVGGASVAGLVAGDGGAFLGTAYAGGSSSAGTVFQIAADGTPSKVADLGNPEGLTLNAGVIQGPGGLLYGTAALGGVHSAGTLFSIAPDKTFAVLGSFQGSRPTNAQLCAAADGKLYGTLRSIPGGLADSIYRLDPAGSFTSVANFTNAVGAQPNGVAQGANGAFYGTAARGGANDKGTVFKYTAADGIVKLVDFAGPNGANPSSLLVLAPDGNFYGTTPAGGKSDKGTLFRLSPDGVLTTLFSFSGTNGAFPAGPLVVGFDRNLYGMTNSGGTVNCGVVYRLTTSGKVGVLANLDGVAAAFPLGGLTVGPGGNLYGLGQAGGGTKKYGTIFKITTKGVVSLLKAFSGGADGAYPLSTLALGPDQNLYGTTSNTIFRIVTGNRAPLAVNDSLVLPAFNASLTKNDSDPDADPIRVSAVTQGAHGSVTLNANGTVDYVPDGGFSGTDSFTYTITDPLGATSTATVNVTLPSNVITAGLGGYTGVLALSGTTRGYCGIAVTTGGLFTGAVFLDGVKTALKGTFNAATGVYQQTIARPGLASLQLTLTLDPGRNQITGTIAAGVETFPIALQRVFPAYTAAAPTKQAGRYTVLLPTASSDVGNAAIPQGTGYAAMTVSAVGAVSLTGRLGDGTPFMASSRLTRDDHFPIYVPLYATKGYLAGLVSFSAKAESDADGQFGWKRPTSAAAFPAGFITYPTLQAARYTATAPILSLPVATGNAKLVYRNLPLTKTLTISKANIVVVTNPAADKTALTITSTTGIFSGTYVDGAIPRSVAGALYLKGATPRGEGFYLRATTSEQAVLSAP